MKWLIFIYYRLCSKIHVKRMVKKMGIYSTAKETIKDAVNMAQQADNIPLYKSVLDAYNSAIELMSENVDLREEIKELKEQVFKKGHVIKIAEAYYLHDDNKDLEGPYCMRCYDDQQKLIHYGLTKDYSNPRAKCPVCKFTTYSYSENTKRSY